MRRSYVLAVTLVVVGGILCLWGIPRLTSVVTPWVLVTRSALLIGEGQYGEASSLLQRALAIIEQMPSPTHPDTADILSSLGALYSEMGAYAKAEPLLKRALTIQEQVQGSEHPKTASTLNNLAALYLRMGADAQAERLLKRALAIQEQALEPTHPETSRSLNNLGGLYLLQGDYTQAEPLLKRSLAIKEEVLGPQDLDTGSTMNNLGMLYGAQGALTQAEPLLQQALEIREEALGPIHPDTASSLMNLGNLYRVQGAYKQAEPLLQRAVAIRERVLGDNHPDTAQALVALSDLYRELEDYAHAESLLQRVLGMAEQGLGPAHPSTATILNNLAMLYQLHGAHTQAEPLVQRALIITEQVMGPTHPDTAQMLNNLGMVYLAQGAYRQAEPLLKRALAIRKESLGPTHPVTAQSLHALGVLYQFQGAYRQAEPLLKRALAITEQVFGLAHPDTTFMLGNLGALWTDFKSDTQAAKWLHKAAQSEWQFVTEHFPTLTHQEQQQFHKKRALGESGYMWYLLTRIPNLDRAIGYQVTLLSKQLLAEATRQENIAFQRIWAEAPREWQALWQMRESLRRMYAAHSLHEQPNRVAFGQKQPDFPAVPTPELAARIEELDHRLRRENPAYLPEARVQEITVQQVQQQLQAKQVLLEYVQFRHYDKATKHLSETSHYGVYIVRGGATPVVAVDLGDAAPIDAAIHDCQIAMQEMIQPFNEEMTPSHAQIRKSEAKLAQASSILRRLIWQPVAHLLTNVTRVYVAPDGQLSLFPFEALAHETTSEQPQYLVEEREIVYLNTGRDLARLALTVRAESASNVSPRTAVLIGNPKFDAQPKEIAQVVAGLATTAPLRAISTRAGAGATLGEVASQDGLRIPRDWTQYRELDTLLTQAQQQLRGAGWTVTTQRDRDAVEAAVLQLKAPQILQLATHGYLLDRATPDRTGNLGNPLLRSMLLLAGVNHATPEQTVFYRVGKNLLTEAEAEQRQLSAEVRQQARVDIGDGILTAYEVSGMNLQGTELVNLTACKTGLGTVTPEGVAGLRQAFFFAGARALTTSLWEVPVNETTQQIEDFYARWLGSSEGQSGMTRYAAFRQTQLAALAQARKKYGAGHPFFWAGFIYLGDPGDLASGALRPN